MSVGGWKSYDLGDLTVWKSGGTPSKSDQTYWNGDVPWISAKTFIGSKISDSNIKITKAGLDNGSRLAGLDSILLLVRGSGLFKDIPIGIVTRPVAFNQDIKAIEVDKTKVLPLFLMYWLISNKTLLYHRFSRRL